MSEEKLTLLVQVLYRDNKFKKHCPNIVTLQQYVEYIKRINGAYVKNWKEYFEVFEEIDDENKENSDD